MHQHPLPSVNATPFDATAVESAENHVRSSRLQDIGDAACCAVLASLSLAMTPWLWRAVISPPAPR
jgi:hypothetical protein